MGRGNLYTNDRRVFFWNLALLSPWPFQNLESKTLPSCLRFVTSHRQIDSLDTALNTTVLVSAVQPVLLSRQTLKSIWSETRKYAKINTSITIPLSSTTDCDHFFWDHLQVKKCPPSVDRQPLKSSAKKFASPERASLTFGSPVWSQMVVFYVWTLKSVHCHGQPGSI